MGLELDLLAKYPRSPRDPSARAAVKTAEDIAIARKFGKDFFDGARKHGYGGYTFSDTRWEGVVTDMIEHYAPFHSVLDVGCAKGFMLQEFKKQVPAVDVRGLDISQYAISQSPIKEYLTVGTARRLPYSDQAFDLVISINTIHNLARHGCIHALEEIERVGRQAYITVDAYRNEEERKRVEDWNLTALTILHVDEWKALFKEAGYSGDYGFWMP